MQTHILLPKGPSFGLYLRHVWHKRHLMRVLAWRDIRVKYAQTLLGITWSLIQPMGAVIIYTLFFTYIVPIKAPFGIPYPAFVFSGVVLWNLFYYICLHSSNALLNAHNLVTKMKFPRLLLPLSKVYVGCMDFIWGYLCLLIYIGFFSSHLISIPYEKSFFITMICALLSILLVCLQALCVGIWTSALSLRKRDAQHLLPFLLGFALWLTPVFYASNHVPQTLSHLLQLNPLFHSIALSRYALFTPYPLPNLTNLFLSSAATICILISGMYYFKHMENKWMDTL